MLVPAESHLVLHETGAGAANAGVQFSAIGDGGIYDDRCRPRRHQAAGPPRLPADYAAGGREHPQPRPAASCFRPRPSRERSPSRASMAWRLPRRRATSERGRRQRPPGGRSRDGLRPRRHLAQQGPGAARRLAAGGLTRSDRPRPPLPAHGRRRDAPGRHPGGGRLVRPRHHVERLADDHANARLLANELLRGTTSSSTSPPCRPISSSSSWSSAAASPTGHLRRALPRARRAAQPASVAHGSRGHPPRPDRRAMPRRAKVMRAVADGAERSPPRPAPSARPSRRGRGSATPS